MDSNDSLGDITNGGIAAPHRTRVSLPLYVAPSAAAQTDAFNTLSAPLFPTACWRINDSRFEFNSSFGGAAAADELAMLARLRDPKDANGALMSVFGHADPVGADDYNKRLSDRRATAIYALLTRSTDLWEDLFLNSQGTDHWGRRSIKRMLIALGYAPGPLDLDTDDYDSAVKQFQQAAGLSVDGMVGPNTRKALFTQYMDAVCVDASGAPFSYDASAFLGKGQSDGKGDRQGCSDFNPILVFSQDDSDAFDAAEDKTKRNAANAPNRRVVIYLFPADTVVDPSDWPCPKTGESGDGCKSQFWDDGDARRRPTDAERQVRKRGKTFACRFYDRFARTSPCEAVRKSITVYLLDENRERMPAGTPYRVTSGPQVLRGILQEPGLLALNDVLDNGHVEVAWGDPVGGSKEARHRDGRHAAAAGRTAASAGDPDAFLKAKMGNLPADTFFAHPLLPHVVPELLFESPTGTRFRYARQMLIDAPKAPGFEGEELPAPTANRLYNLGYPRSAAGLQAFARDFGVDPTSDTDTLSNALDSKYDNGLGRDEAT